MSGFERGGRFDGGARFLGQEPGATTPQIITDLSLGSVYEELRAAEEGDWILLGSTVVEMAAETHALKRENVEELARALASLLPKDSEIVPEVAGPELTTTFYLTRCVDVDSDDFELVVGFGSTFLASVDPGVIDQAESQERKNDYWQQMARDAMTLRAVDDEGLPPAEWNRLRRFQDVLKESGEISEGILPDLLKDKELLRDLVSAMLRNWMTEAKILEGRNDEWEEAGWDNAVKAILRPRQ